MSFVIFAKIIDQSIWKHLYKATCRQRIRRAFNHLVT